ncbi:hypothetical protein GUJ93_ZPchr0006g42466 [Zizania palustris]|uniref:Uncharacterized protein n=1 Tax=Zizania palustris TaxID=103762 RepID=A0A8J5W3F8_ZIZPA|nr:hypothetical protein GUJ93_ZPchr0006g42466 [Zizania palustris]
MTAASEPLPWGNLLIATAATTMETVEGKEGCLSKQVWAGSSNSAPIQSSSSFSVIRSILRRDSVHVYARLTVLGHCHHVAIARFFGAATSPDGYVFLAYDRSSPMHPRSPRSSMGLIDGASGRDGSMAADQRRGKARQRVDGTLPCRGGGSAARQRIDVAAGRGSGSTAGATDRSRNRVRQPINGTTAWQGERSTA